MQSTKRNTKHNSMRAQPEIRRLGSTVACTPHLGQRRVTGAPPAPLPRCIVIPRKFQHTRAVREVPPTRIERHEQMQQAGGRSVYLNGTSFDGKRQWGCSIGVGLLQRQLSHKPGEPARLFTLGFQIQDHLPKTSVGTDKSEVKLRCVPSLSCWANHTTTSAPLSPQWHASTVAEAGIKLQTNLQQFHSCLPSELHREVQNRVPSRQRQRGKIKRLHAHQYTVPTTRQTH